MKNFTTVSPNEANGTFLQGYIQADYRKLKEIFAEPTESDGYKSDAEWIIKFDSGEIATIYNYKDGKNYCGDDGLTLDQIKHWHIGGKSPEVVSYIEDILKELSLWTNSSNGL